MSESDLSTITTKKVRLELEKNTGQSLTAIKKEINEIIQEAFEGLSSQQETLQETSQEASQEVVKHERSPTKNPVKKTTVSKSTKKTTPEKRKREMPLVRILPPLSYIVKTDYVSYELTYLLLTPSLPSPPKKKVFTYPNCQQNVGIYSRAQITGCKQQEIYRL